MEFYYAEDYEEKVVYFVQPDEVPGWSDFIRNHLKNEEEQPVSTTL